MKFLWLVLALTCPPALAKGAIAFSMNPDGVWFAFAEWNRPTSTLAEDAALAGCKGKGGVACKIIKAVDNGCVSLAVTNEGKYALGTGNTQLKSQSKAVDACLALEPEGSCVVRRSFCDNTGGFIPADACQGSGNVERGP